MSKKTLILTKNQLDEICGGSFAYLDNTPQYDSKRIYASDVNLNNDNPTGDDVATDQSNMNWRAGRVMTGKIGGLMEINSNIQGKVFGAENGDTGHTAQATAMSKSRYNKAKETVLTGATQEDKEKAMQTIKRMKQNSPNIEQQINQFDAAVRNDKTIRNNKVANGERVIASHTKENGNGKGHTPKNGTITYYE